MELLPTSGTFKLSCYNVPTFFHPIFVQIPLPVSDIEDGHDHKVTVGVSDGFFIDTVHFISKYHVIEGWRSVLNE